MSEPDDGEVVIGDFLPGEPDAEVWAQAIRLASNIVEDFNETESDAPELSRDMQILGIARPITDIAEERAARVMLAALKVLDGLKRGDCWCEVGIGNPMMQGKHSPECVAAQAFWDAC